MNADQVARLNFDELKAEDREVLLLKAFRWMRAQKRLPYPVYMERVQTFPTVFVDVFTCVKGPFGWEILLDERPANDAHFAGRHHVPGTTVMLRDSFEVAKNVTIDESVSSGAGDTLRFLGVINFPKMHREHAVVIAYLRILSQKPEKPASGAFHRLAELPEPLIEHQRRTYFHLVRAALECGERWQPIVVELLEATE